MKGHLYCARCRGSLPKKGYRKHFTEFLALTTFPNIGAEISVTIFEALSQVVGFRLSPYPPHGEGNSLEVGNSSPPEEYCLCQSCEKLLQDLYVAHVKFFQENLFILKNSILKSRNVQVLVEVGTQTDFNFETEIEIGKRKAPKIRNCHVVLQRLQQQPSHNDDSAENIMDFAESPAVTEPVSKIHCSTNLRPTTDSRSTKRRKIDESCAQITRDSPAPIPIQESARNIDNLAPPSAFDEIPDPDLIQSNTFGESAESAIKSEPEPQPESSFPTGTFGTVVNQSEIITPHLGQFLEMAINSTSQSIPANANSDRSLDKTNKVQSRAIAPGAAGAEGKVVGPNSILKSILSISATSAAGPSNSTSCSPRVKRKTEMPNYRLDESDDEVDEGGQSDTEYQPPPSPTSPGSPVVALSVPVEFPPQDHDNPTPSPLKPPPKLTISQKQISNLDDQVTQERTTRTRSSLRLKDKIQMPNYNLDESEEEDRESDAEYQPPPSPATAPAPPGPEFSGSPKSPPQALDEPNPAKPDPTPTPMTLKPIATCQYRPKWKRYNVKCPEPGCVRLFRDSGPALQFHRRRDHGDMTAIPRNVCPEPECGRFFLSPAQLRIHRDRVHDLIRAFTCTICNKSFVTKKELNMHAFTHAKVKPSKSTWKCREPGCNNRIFPTPSTLRVHRMRFHGAEKPFSCSVCDKTFAIMRELRTHQAVHSDEKKFKCPEPECEKSFKLEFHLTFHRTTHQLDKPFPCPICNSKFASAIRLTRHHRDTHLEKQHLCPECGKTFSSQDRLRGHSLVHTEDRPVECKDCKKSYKSTKHLKTHRKVAHAENRSFVCEVCGKAFKANGALTFHKVQHENKRKFKCPAPGCTADFNYNHHLAQHLTGTAHKLGTEEVKKWSKNPSSVTLVFN